uniref:Uncharacterized protein n=1 Tax=Magallana gigas TaxID=29159 RepID=K1QB69_MAGGI|eukprot:XP_011423575.1 PREDICTED: uncharacterized protein LOC105325622 [Crassostrea gigas]
MLSTLVVGILLVGASTGFRLGGQRTCRVVFWNENTGEVNTQNATCSSGSIEWHYPAGRIRLHFPDVPGQLCITRGIAAYDDVISRVYLENGDQPQDLQFDADGTACVDPQGEEATVVFVGPQSMRTYMASFGYEVKSPDLGVLDRLHASFNNFVQTASRPFGALFRKWNIQMNINPL